MIIKYYLSSTRFTIQVNTDERGIIKWTAPVACKFLGQPIINLVNWSRADVIEVIN